MKPGQGWRSAAADALNSSSSVARRLAFPVLQRRLRNMPSAELVSEKDGMLFASKIRIEG